tara:strand:- start:3119 stop:3508 length:390 start_codon:yes stop_codon:yes gene_type:complete
MEVPLKVWEDDYCCMVETTILGGTCPIVDQPWTPYAVLVGVSVDEVNRRRAQRNREHLPLAMGGYLGVDPSWRLLYEYQPIDPETLEVGMPKIVSVFRQIDGAEIPEAEWKPLRDLEKEDIVEMLKRYM